MTVKELQISKAQIIMLALRSIHTETTKADYARKMVMIIITPRASYECTVPFPLVDPCHSPYVFPGVVCHRRIVPKNPYCQ